MALVIAVLALILLVGWKLYTIPSDALQRNEEMS